MAAGSAVVALSNSRIDRIAAWGSMANNTSCRLFAMIRRIFGIVGDCREYLDGLRSAKGDQRVQCCDTYVGSAPRIRGQLPDALAKVRYYPFAGQCTAAASTDASACSNSVPIERKSPVGLAVRRRKPCPTPSAPHGGRRIESAGNRLFE